VAGARIDQAIPTRYRGIADAAIRGRAQLTVLSFSDDHVVTSNDVARAVRRLGASADPLVAFAHDATVEAVTALRALGASIITLRSFGWTDERYRRIRQPKSHDEPFGSGNRK
jgi:hypothetical protein